MLCSEQLHKTLLGGAPFSHVNTKLYKMMHGWFQRTKGGLIGIVLKKTSVSNWRAACIWPTDTSPSACLRMVISLWFEVRKTHHAGLKSKMMSLCRVLQYIVAMLWNFLWKVILLEAVSASPVQIRFLVKKHLFIQWARKNETKKNIRVWYDPYFSSLSLSSPCCRRRLLRQLLLSVLLS